MGLPDVEGDVVAAQLLDEKLDLQIIVITADEKTTKRVNKTISSGVTAFIQKPFTLNEVKKAIDTAESEYSIYNNSNDMFNKLTSLISNSLVL